MFAHAVTASAHVWQLLQAVRSSTHAALVAVNASQTLNSGLRLTVLKKRADFLRVNADPKRISTKTLVLLAAPNDLGVSRVGYTVSKKTSKLAVERNRIKRRLRAIAGEILPTAPQGYDYVIIGKKEILRREFADLKGDLKYALRKLEL